MDTDHVKMLMDIGELNDLFEQEDLSKILQRTVAVVSDHMHADVCSIYLYDEESDLLTLKATKGLNQKHVNTLTLKKGEGLVGNALEGLTAVCEQVGKENPKFKYIPDSGEEVFDAFLAVPIRRGRVKIGVLVVQRTREKCFEETDVMALQATASQLASMLENIQLLLTPLEKIRSQNKRKFDFEKFKFLKGKKASKGFAYSPTIVIDKEKKYHLSPEEKFSDTYTLEEFNNAVIKTYYELEELQKKVDEKLSDAASLIFEAHLLMLKDKGFIGGMKKLIEEGENPPNAVIQILSKYKDIFSKSESKIIQEKVQDIEDLSKRIIDNIISSERYIHHYKDHIIIAEDLYPSDLLKFSAEGISGVILISGGVTSHIAILARSLEIPMVFIDEPELRDIPSDTLVLIDADIGNIYINPTDEIINKFEDKEASKEKYYTLESKYKGDTYTKDKTRVNLMINVNLLSDCDHIDHNDIDGIGLYRTEFPFIIRNNFPSEEEQFIIYKKLIDLFQNKTVTFRTLDIGGDKVLSYYEVAKEANPFLGMRSIRFSLTHKDIFKEQIRAILRSAVNKDVKIMFPMISSIDELLQSKEIVYQCIDELISEKIQCNTNPHIGIMVEIPSVINMIDDFAKHADFFSIGTNDLIQYTIAVDRTNEKVSDMYIPHHPAILRSLYTVSRAAEKAQIDVSVCGDMANNVAYIPFLIGIGILSLSVDSMFIPGVKKALGELVIDDAKKYSNRLLACSTVKETSSVINNYCNIM